jgi:predicted ribosome quality control (RQC) complex YloA/Tae2 family protein
MNDQVKIKELTIRIDEVLYYLWDPIGISDEPNARGEYSSYVNSILNLVINEKVEKIADRLSEIETKLMELPNNSEKNKMIAERLVQDKHAIQEGLK